MEAIALPGHRLPAQRRGKVEWKQSSDSYCCFTPGVHNFHGSFLPELITTCISYRSDFIFVVSYSGGEEQGNLCRKEILWC